MLDKTAIEYSDLPMKIGKPYIFVLSEYKVG